MFAVRITSTSGEGKYPKYSYAVNPKKHKGQAWTMYEPEKVTKFVSIKAALNVANSYSYGSPEVVDYNQAFLEVYLLDD